MHVLSKTMQWVALTLAGFVMVFFSYMLIAPLFTQTAHAPTPIATYQIWLEGAVYFLSLAVFILALLTRRGHYLLFSALILLQGFLGARLGHWDAFQTNFFRQPFLFEYQQQWLIGCYVFILTQALFQSRILSFAYARALQFFLFFSAWLWLLAALSFPSTYFWLFFQYALPIYLMTLGTSLVAQEWLQDQHLAPTAYAYAIPTLIASVVCGVFTYLALSLHILPTLTYSFGAFIF